MTILYSFIMVYIHAVGRTLQSCLSLLFSLTRSTGNAFHRKDGSKVKVLCCEISLEYSFILYWFSAALIFLACHICAGKDRDRAKVRSRRFLNKQAQRLLSSGTLGVYLHIFMSIWLDVFMFSCSINSRFHACGEQERSKCANLPLRAGWSNKTSRVLVQKWLKAS